MIEPGGLAFDRDGSLIVGFGNSIANGTIGDTDPQAGLLRVDPDAGASEVYATGLSMANGVTSAPTAATPPTTSAPTWTGSATATPSMGSPRSSRATGSSSTPPGATSTSPRPWSTPRSRGSRSPRPERHPLCRRRARRPGRRPRRDGNRRARPALRRRQPRRPDLEGGRQPAGDLRAARRSRPFPRRPSAVATGSNRGPFPAENLYAVSFNGLLLELVDVAKAPKPSPIRLTVSPRRTRAGAETRFRFRATTYPTADRSAGRVRARQPLEQVRIRFAGGQARTQPARPGDDRGDLPRAGSLPRPRQARGYRSDRATVRVRPGNSR